MTKVTLTMELAEAKLLMDAARKEMVAMGEELFQVSNFGDPPSPQKIARRRALSAAVDCLFDSISQAELTIGAAQATQPALVNTGDMTYAE